MSSEECIFSAQAFHFTLAGKFKSTFIISESANFTLGCNSTGAHFNPTKVTHGDRTDAVRHVGDLGNVRTDGNGTATFNFTVDMVSLFTNSTNSVVR